ncbi:hypothetical protein SRABI106_03789 [Rahnella aquatilis]|nr:hypothetical protein SRABI106_03789 [Rahnella aquatilis]
MQVIDILRNQQEVLTERFFQRGQRVMCGIRFEIFCLQLTAALIIKTLYQFRITAIAFGRRHILNMMFFPQTVSGAESTNARLGGNPCAGQHHDKRLLQRRSRHRVTVENIRPEPLMANALIFAKPTQTMTCAHEVLLTLCV